METARKRTQMQNSEGMLGWILAGVGTIVSTLAGLVAFFYRQQINDHKDREAELSQRLDIVEKRADACENDREELRIKCAVIEARINALENKSS
jgi:hypothetical protein